MYHEMDEHALPRELLPRAYELSQPHIVPMSFGRDCRVLCEKSQILGGLCGNPTAAYQDQAGHQQ